MKKAISYLPFIFIFALILGALILVWAFPVIQDLIGISKQIEISKTLRDLDTTIQSYYNLGEGSTKTVMFSLPSEVKYFCFYNLESTNTLTDKELSLIDESLPYLLKLKSNKNIFIFPRDIKPSDYIISNFKTTENPLCLRTYNALKFTLENKGSYVEIRS